MCSHKWPPPQESWAVWPAGSPYTYIKSGYALVESKFAGLIIQPSSVTPSETGTLKNSPGRGISGSTTARCRELSTSVRTTRCVGNCTSSMTEGLLKFEYVWNAQCASGEML